MKIHFLINEQKDNATFFQAIKIFAFEKKCTVGVHCKEQNAMTLEEMKYISFVSEEDNADITVFLGDFNGLSLWKARVPLNEKTMMRAFICINDSVIENKGLLLSRWQKNAWNIKKTFSYVTVFEGDESESEEKVFVENVAFQGSIPLREVMEKPVMAVIFISAQWDVFFSSLSLFEKIDNLQEEERKSKAIFSSIGSFFFKNYIPRKKPLAWKEYFHPFTLYGTKQGVFFSCPEKQTVQQYQALFEWLLLLDVFQ